MHTTKGQITQHPKRGTHLTRSEVSHALLRKPLLRHDFDNSKRRPADVVANHLQVRELADGLCFEEGVGGPQLRLDGGDGLRDEGGCIALVRANALDQVRERGLEDRVRHRRDRRQTDDALRPSILQAHCCLLSRVVASRLQFSGGGRKQRQTPTFRRPKLKGVVIIIELGS